MDPTGHWYGPDEYDPAGIETLLEAYAFAEMSGDESVLRWPGGTPYDKPPRAIDRVVGLAADFTPGVGDVKGLIEVFTGEDLVTGERLGYWRWLGLLGVSELRHLDEASDALRAVENVAEGAGLSRRFRRFTKSNFRENLRRLTGVAEGEIKGLEAHHVLPQKFEREFNKAGLNIHDPRFGSWVGMHAHRRWSYEYNLKWGRFLDISPTREEILQFAQRLAKEYGFDVHFDVP